MSGSHGDENGVSGLTDNNDRNVDEGYAFYKEDCELLGIKPGPHKRSSRLPTTDWSELQFQKYWNSIPDITKPAEKVYENDEQLLLYNCNLQDLDIRVCNICYYHGNDQKLIDDITMVW